MSSTSPTYDVVIAGAGPVGLLLACELRLAGLSVLILEQAHDPHSPLKALPFGMRGLTAPTLEALDRRGLLAEVTEPNGDAPRAHWQNQARRPGGHFAGIQFFQDRVDPSRWPYRLPGEKDFSRATDMATLETALAVRAAALGVEIRRGCTVQALDQTAKTVIVQAGGERFQARWLVGCDGGRSTVRKLGGFNFIGTEPEFTGYSLEVELADPTRLNPGRHYTLAGMYTFTPPGVVALVEFDGGAAHRSDPTLAEVQAVLQRVTGAELTVTALRQAATWTDRAFQASAYRQGRVLLAGDAAHIHSPLGGQGLNLGLGDAMNLGWKLAATIRGEAPSDLLDTYTAERHPVGARVLDWSRAQVVLMRPSPGSRALEGVVRDLIETRDGATYFAERVWAASLRYDLGDAHPLAGRSTPDFRLSDGSRVDERLRTGAGLLLDFDGRPSLQHLIAPWRRRIGYVGLDADDRLGLRALLIRPDGIVAWASDGEPDTAALTHTICRWFGTPTEPQG